MTDIITTTDKLERRRQLHLGYFDTKEEAHAAYLTAARIYAGEFVREK